MQGVIRTASEARSCKQSASTIFQSTYANIGSLRASYSSPLLHRVYHHRNLCIKRYTEVSLLSSAHILPQLLILGAGLDEYQHYQSIASIYCVDFPDVIDQRCPSTYEKCIDCDLRDIPQLFDQLFIHGFDYSTPTVVLLEFVLAYLDRTSIDKLLSSLVTKLSRAVIVAYDPILPAPGAVPDFYDKMHASFSSRGAPLLHCCDSAANQCSMFRSNQWCHVSCVSIQTALTAYFTVSERRVPIDCEAFDEFASLALLNQHYAMTLATTDLAWFDAIHCGLVSATLHSSWNTLQSRLVALETRLQSLEASTSSSWSVRAVCDADTDAAARLFESCFALVASRYKAVQKFVKLSMKEIVQSKETSRAWVAVLSGRVIGYGALSTSAEGVGAVKHMCCAAEFRGQGVASRILTCILDEARRQRLSSVELSTISELTAAVALYKKFGFFVLKEEVQQEGYSLTHMATTIIESSTT